MFISNQISISLNNLQPEYYNTILYKGGWSNLSDYEINVGNNTGIWNEWTSFPITFQQWNGYNILSIEKPVLDPKSFFVCRLMISSLQNEVKYKILDHMGMTQTEFEMNFTKFNSLYVYVPYKKWFIESYIKSLEEETMEKDDLAKDKNDDEECKSVDMDIDSDSYSPKNDLEGFCFLFNETTQNSYILYNTDPNYTYTKSWNLFKNSRPIYYSKKYRGYIVGLSMKEDMKIMGAHEIIEVD